MRALLSAAAQPFDARAAFDDFCGEDDDAAARQTPTHDAADARYLVAVVCFRSDHYTAFQRTSAPSKIDAHHKVFWTYHDRFLEKSSGDFDWLLDQCAPRTPHAKTLQPCLLFFATPSFS